VKRGGDRGQGCKKVKKRLERKGTGSATVGVRGGGRTGGEGGPKGKGDLRGRGQAPETILQERMPC